MRKKLSVLILACVLGCNVTLADEKPSEFAMVVGAIKLFALAKHMALADGKGDKAEMAFFEKDFVKDANDKEAFMVIKELYDQIDIKNPKNSVEYSCGTLKTAIGNDQEFIEGFLKILEWVMDADGVRDAKEIALYEKVKKLLQ